MEAIRTYAVGNGEITLTAQDAEDLRLILQTEYLRRTIEEILEQNKDDFNFSGPRSRRHFVDEMVRLNNDLVNYDSSYYEETMTQNIYNIADLHKLVR